jgi:hypothetical protein
MGEGMKRARKAARATRTNLDIVDILRANATACSKMDGVVNALGPVMAAAADEIEQLRAAQQK